MIRIAALMHQILSPAATGPDSRAAAAIRKYLTTPLTDEAADPLLQDLLDALRQHIAATPHDAVVATLLENLTEGTTVALALRAPDEDTSWSFDSPEMNDLPADSVVGILVVAACVRCDFMLCDVPDTQQADLAREAVMDQCQVWYFG